MTDPEDSAFPEPTQGPGLTIPQRGARREPRLPHERDESSDSQTQTDNDTEGAVQKAHDDVEAGRQDTSGAPEREATYDRLKRTP